MQVMLHAVRAQSVSQAVVRLSLLGVMLVALAVPTSSSAVQWRPQGAYFSAAGGLTLDGVYVDITCQATLNGGPTSGASLPAQMRPYGCKAWNVNPVDVSFEGKIDLIARTPSTNGDGGGDVGAIGTGEIIQFEIPNFCTIRVVVPRQLNGFTRPFSQYGLSLRFSPMTITSYSFWGPAAAYCSPERTVMQLYGAYWNNDVNALQIYP